MLQSQIACHTFLCLYQPRPLRNWLTETRCMPKQLGLFYVAFLTVPVYIQWEQFIIFQVAVPTPSHQVPSNFMLDFKMLRLNLLNIVTLLTLKVVLLDHSTRLKTISTIFKYKFSNSTLKATGILLSQLPVSYQIIYISQLIHKSFGNVYIAGLKKMERKGLVEGIPENLPDL